MMVLVANVAYLSCTVEAGRQKALAYGRTAPTGWSEQRNDTILKPA
ncbi:hypothetical protein [Fischerella thermalis]|nr:hypothetical protein [Fischerella thermalis]